MTVPHSLTLSLRRLLSHPLIPSFPPSFPSSPDKKQATPTTRTSTHTPRFCLRSFRYSGGQDCSHFLCFLCSLASIGSLCFPPPSYSFLPPLLKLDSANRYSHDKNTPPNTTLTYIRTLTRINTHSCTRVAYLIGTLSITINKERWRLST